MDIVLPHLNQYEHRNWILFLQTFIHEWKGHCDTIVQKVSNSYKLLFTNERDIVLHQLKKSFNSATSPTLGSCPTLLCNILRNFCKTNWARTRQNPQNDIGARQSSLCTQREAKDPRVCSCGQRRLIRPNVICWFCRAGAQLIKLN